MISCQELGKSYGGRKILDSVTFEVSGGSITGFLGLNGAGKTTTLRVLLGLAHADKGNALIDGVPISQHPEPWLKVGAMLDTCGAHPGMSGRQHLRVLGRMIGIGETAVDEALDQVSLLPAAHRRIGAYSLGMKQRLALAAAIMAKPELLILDEPGNGLDPAGLRMLREILVAHAAAGGTVFLSSHHLGDLEEIADSVVVIHEGRIVSQGNPGSLMPNNRWSVLSPESERCRQFLKEQGYPIETSSEGKFVILCDNVDALSRELASAGIPILHIQRIQPSLENFFMDIIDTRSEANRETVNVG